MCACVRVSEVQEVRLNVKKAKHLALCVCVCVCLVSVTNVFHFATHFPIKCSNKYKRLYNILLKLTLKCLNARAHVCVFLSTHVAHLYCECYVCHIG